MTFLRKLHVCLLPLTIAVLVNSMSIHFVKISYYHCEPLLKRLAWHINRSFFSVLALAFIYGCYQKEQEHTQIHFAHAKSCKKYGVRKYGCQHYSHWCNHQWIHKHEP